MFSDDEFSFIYFLCKFLPRDIVFLKRNDSNDRVMIQFDLKALLKQFPDYLEKQDKRIFSSYIFCGAGEHSQYEIIKLYHRIYCAISALSGSQQNGGMGSEYSEEDEKKYQKDIDDVIEDIVVVFGAQDRFKKV